MAMGYGTAGQMPDMIINGKFLQNTQGFVVGANWAVVKTSFGYGMQHTAGAVESFSQTAVKTTLTSVTYHFYVHLSDVTAGTLTLHEGSGATGTVLSAIGDQNWDEVFTTDKVLSFTPSTDFNGTVDVIVVRALKIQP